MKKIIFAVFCLTASAGWTQEANEKEVDESEKVDLRMSVIESIVVTAEKSPVTSDEGPDQEIDAILDEAEALEDDAASE